MNPLLNIAGEVCKIIFPIHEEVFLGNSESTIAVCTLSSMELLKEISNSDLMGKIAISGRLLSENKGIDELIRNIIKNPNLQTLIVCGKEVSGHKTGHALVSLYKYGIDDDSRIVNSHSPSPFLTVSRKDVEKFQKQITLVDRIGETRLDRII
ncbi:tetrahydromethanopterin S-methyltransferase subunit A [Candidatus Nitrosotenuis chungbukensis]|uniref:tetrahydromethanopterin S-methyltransferase subunit A n=1 Tax=Candidatus Nitrosotenuis chungbukensis TaxID=1353246 RepID=UPI0005B26B26|nr:tetrahydromethanopterin S-methyltransferase subunit A [Candidatus Nitrosotenuis chungbukensis]WKT58479.1 tetrahydromethanopterin S-methyltransferase subunit A [Candidatus Nitrosotenuis chungbukensis]